MLWPVSEPQPPTLTQSQTFGFPTLLDKLQAYPQNRPLAPGQRSTP